MTIKIIVLLVYLWTVWLPLSNFNKAKRSFSYRLQSDVSLIIPATPWGRVCLLRTAFIEILRKLESSKMKSFLLTFGHVHIDSSYLQTEMSWSLMLDSKSLNSYCYTEEVVFLIFVQVCCISRGWFFWSDFQDLKGRLIHLKIQFSNFKIIINT